VNEKEIRPGKSVEIIEKLNAKANSISDYIDFSILD